MTERWAPVRALMDAVGIDVGARDLLDHRPSRPWPRSRGVAVRARPAIVASPFIVLSVTVVAMRVCGCANNFGVMLDLIRARRAVSDVALTAEVEARYRSRSFWLDSLAGAAAPPSRARSRRRGRRRDHRRRLHRALDRLRARPARPDAAHRGARGGDRRLRRVRAQRRWCSALFAGKPRGDREDARARCRRRAAARAVRDRRRGRHGRRSRADRCALPQGWHAGRSRPPRCRCRGCARDVEARAGRGASVRTDVALARRRRRRHARLRRRGRCTAPSSPRTAPGSIRPVSPVDSPRPPSVAGVTIYEQTRVVEISPRRLQTRGCPR